MRFLSYCRSAHVLHAASALRQLLTLSLDAHKELIKAASADHLLRQTGWLKLFRTEAGFARFSRDLEIVKSFGARFTVYDREQIRQIEPGLKPVYYKAVLMDDTCAVSSPADLTDAYVALFQSLGGIVEQSKVTGLRQKDASWCVECGARTFTADDLVLSAGAWSAEMASWLGYHIPMVWERGYHVNLQPGEAPALNRAIHDIEAGFVMAPMKAGLRVTSGLSSPTEMPHQIFSRLIRQSRWRGRHMI